MSDLALTPTRRRRLEDAERGDVYRDETGAYHQPTGRKCTAEMDELERAGWVKREPDRVFPQRRERYRLTDVGQALLSPEPVVDIAPESVWRDRERPGRRLKVEHVDELQVSVLTTYSPAADAWEHTLTTDVVPRGEWTVQRFVPESTPDGVS